MNVIVVVSKVMTLADIAEIIGLCEKHALKIRRIGYHLVNDMEVKLLNNILKKVKLATH